MRTFISVVVCAVMFTVSADAQPAIVFGGYEWAHPDVESSRLLTSDLNGWNAGAVVPIGHQFAIAADADGLYGRTVKTGLVVGPARGSARPWFYTVDAGPRFTFADASRVNPFVEGLVGVTHGQIIRTNIDFLSTVADTRIEGGAAGGVLVHLTHALGIQGEVAYRTSHLFDQRFNRFQIGANAAWSIGR